MDKFKKILESNNSASTKTSEFKKTPEYTKLKDLCLSIEDGTIECFYIYVNGFITGVPFIEVLVKSIDSSSKLFLNYTKNNDYIDGVFDTLFHDHYSSDGEILENIVRSIEDLDNILFKMNNRISLDKSEEFFEDLSLIDTKSLIDFESVSKFIFDGSDFIDCYSNDRFSVDDLSEIIFYQYDNINLIPCRRYVGAYLIKYDISKYSDISNYYIDFESLNIEYFEHIGFIIKQLKRRLPNTKILIHLSQGKLLNILVIYL